MEDKTIRWQEIFKRSREIVGIDRLQQRIEALSLGDRFIFYTLAAGVAVISLLGLWTLEQTFLVEIPTHGGSIVEGNIGSPQFINPLLAISDADRDLATLTYAGLMGLSGDGSLVPVIAKSYTVSADGKTYTFILRPDALFSDGTPITADDVIFTVQKAQDPSLNSPEYADWSGVTVLAIDRQTIQFTLSKPYAPFLGLTTLGILPSRLWQTITSREFPFTPLQTNPVGAGPFKVTKISRDASGLIKNVTLTANEHYALGRPYLDTIHFNFYPRSEDLVTALKNGVVQSAYDIPSEKVITAPYARVFGVFWNPNEKPVYARAEVRKALSIALDRVALIDSVLGGYATPIMGPVPPGGPIEQAVLPQFDDPIAAAAKVLTNAGWTYDGVARVWKTSAGSGLSGGKLTLDRITIRTSNVPELKGIANAVKADWEKLGISIDIELYEPGDLSQNVIRPRKYEALLYGMVIGRDQDLYAFWDSQERNDPGLNIAQYVNKSVDTLLEDARGSTDPSQRLADLQKIEDTIAADYPAAFIYAPDFTYTVPEGLRGVDLPQIITPADRFATVAKWYQVTDKVWPIFIRS